MLIDVAVPGERNVIKKEAKKILKYEDLIIEIQPMWNVKAKVIPLTFCCRNYFFNFSTHCI